jgi:hypothetical protein
MIYGTFLSEEELRKLLGLDAEDGGSDEEVDDLYGLVEDKLANTDLEYHNPDGYEGWYIGRSWDSVGDNETGKQFKSSVEKALKKIFGEKVSCETHSEAYYS